MNLDHVVLPEFPVFREGPVQLVQLGLPVYLAYLDLLVTLDLQAVRVLLEELERLDRVEAMVSLVHLVEMEQMEVPVQLEQLELLAALEPQVW